MTTSTQPVLPMPPAPTDNRFRLLLLENDTALAELMLGFLARTGFECYSAPDTESGMELFRLRRPHLLITEANTENIDGHAFCRWVRENFGIPILMLGPSDETTEVAAFKIGADDYLSAPLRPAVLMARVVAHLRRAYRYNTPIREDNPFGLPVDQDTPADALPSGWAECELCGYRSPRQKFEKENYLGQIHYVCPNPQCRETDHVIISID